MLIINQVISHNVEEKNITSLDGTYSWSFVTQILHHGEPSHDTFDAKTSIHEEETRMQLTMEQRHIWWRTRTIEKMSNTSQTRSGKGQMISMVSGSCFL